jgi:hypothetical protein
MRVKWVLLYLVLLSQSCWAESSPWSLSARALTPREGPFPIRIVIDIVNYNRATTPEASLKLSLKPWVSPGTRPKVEGPHSWEPLLLEELLPELLPGQQHQIVFPTPYFSSTQLIDQRSSFFANNLGPTLMTQTRVQFRCWVEANP